MKKYIAAAVLAALAVPAGPALADPPPWAPAHGKRAKDRGLYDGYGAITSLAAFRTMIAFGGARMAATTAAARMARPA